MRTEDHKVACTVKQQAVLELDNEEVRPNRSCNRQLPPLDHYWGEAFVVETFNIQVHLPTLTCHSSTRTYSETREITPFGRLERSRHLQDGRSTCAYLG